MQATAVRQLHNRRVAQLSSVDNIPLSFRHGQAREFKINLAIVLCSFASAFAVSTVTESVERRDGVGDPLSRANVLSVETLQCDMDQYTKVRGRARRKSKSFKSESEEYDTLGSDSDTEVGTSSRTESSNHLDDSGPASIMTRSPGPNSIGQREQRLALVPRPVHHSKLVFDFLCRRRQPP